MLLLAGVCARDDPLLESVNQTNRNTVSWTHVRADVTVTSADSRHLHVWQMVQSAMLAVGMFLQQVRHKRSQMHAPFGAVQ